ncbi:hypothetical protein [uncultured Enterovirga sp.]|uniref:hypothetical protein n=1 Tax=uncultured Enterovirga sp. TaxID=2026352 RepID=UPI0035CAF0F0
MTSPLRGDRDAHVVEFGEHRVALAYDLDGETWYVQASSVPGLAGQTGTLDELMDELPILIRRAGIP